MSGCAFRRGGWRPVVVLTLAKSYLRLWGATYQDLALQDPWKPTVWAVLYEGRAPVYQNLVPNLVQRQRRGPPGIGSGENVYAIRLELTKELLWQPLKGWNAQDTGTA